MKRFILILTLIILLSVTISHVYGQTDVILEPTIIGQVIAFSTFLAAGIYYALIGWIGKVARSLSGQNVTIEWGRVLRASILGVLIGTGAFLYMEYQGQSIVVTTIQEFITQASINLVAVMTVYKVIINAYKKDDKVNDDDLDSINRNDIPEEVPPRP